MDKKQLLNKLSQYRESEKKIKFSIDATKCRGCDFCKKNCPTGAISGNIKEPHLIEDDICLRCGVCVSVCPFKAVS